MIVKTLFYLFQLSFTLTLDLIEIVIVYEHTFIKNFLHDDESKQNTYIENYIHDNRRLGGYLLRKTVNHNGAQEVNDKLSCWVTR